MLCRLALSKGTCVFVTILAQCQQIAQFVFAALHSSMSVPVSRLQCSLASNTGRMALAVLHYTFTLTFGTLKERRSHFLGNRHSSLHSGDFTGSSNLNSEPTKTGKPAPRGKVMGIVDMSSPKKLICNDKDNRRQDEFPVPLAWSDRVHRASGPGGVSRLSHPCKRRFVRAPVRHQFNH